EFGIPFQVERACNVIAGGKAISLDLGMVNGRRFLLMMGAGVDALTIRNIDPEAKKRFRKLAFVSTGLKVGFGARPSPFLVQANGREYRASFFVAGNSRYYAGRYGFTPKADPTDGLLDVILFTGMSRPGLATFWLQMPTGLHLQNTKTVYLYTEKAELYPLDRSRVVWFQTDGELAGRLPATVQVDPRAIEVLVP
ncbi:MAG: hypothetical protein GX620_09615, partial [Chloroflexi bacterium]|nr:hypothetical protein [Chloroflexota bacterium]